MIQELTESLVAGKSLSMQQAAAAMDTIMSGKATPAQFGAFVTALRMKGETDDEVTGMARVMRDKSLHVDVDGPLVDTCGTGGDGSGSFNISTAAAMVAVAAGVKIAKHGNRAVTSGCGSADVLEATGVKIDLSPEGVKTCLRQVGIGFMFAPIFHPAMGFAAGPRREIGIRTVFNILGPLTNPAGAHAQVLGVAVASLGPKMIEVLKRLGSQRAMVVHGSDGMDEITTTGDSQVWELRERSISSYVITPGNFGLSSSAQGDLRGGSAEENAAAMKDVLGGLKGPLRDAVVLNAAAALVVSGRTNDFAGGISLAQETLDSGLALEKLAQLVEVSVQAGEAA